MGRTVTDELSQVPRATQELAEHAAEDLLNLHRVAQHAPEDIKQVLMGVAATMSRLSMHVFASIEQGGECVAQIEQRVEEYEEKIGTMRTELRHGEVLRALFRSGTDQSTVS